MKRIEEDNVFWQVLANIHVHKTIFMVAGMLTYPSWQSITRPVLMNVFMSMAVTY